MLRMCARLGFLGLASGFLNSPAFGEMYDAPTPTPVTGAPYSGIFGYLFPTPLPTQGLDAYGPPAPSPVSASPYGGIFSYFFLAGPTFVPTSSPSVISASVPTPTPQPSDAVITFGDQTPRGGMPVNVPSPAPLSCEVFSVEGALPAYAYSVTYLEDDILAAYTRLRAEFNHLTPEQADVEIMKKLNSAEFWIELARQARQDVSDRQADLLRRMKEEYPVCSEALTAFGLPPFPLLGDLARTHSFIDLFENHPIEKWGFPVWSSDQMASSLGFDKYFSDFAGIPLVKEILARLQLRRVEFPEQEANLREEIRCVTAERRLLQDEQEALDSTASDYATRFAALENKLVDLEEHRDELTLKLEVVQGQLAFVLEALKATGNPAKFVELFPELRTDADYRAWVNRFQRFGKTLFELAIELNDKTKVCRDIFQELQTLRSPTQENKELRLGTLALLVQSGAPIVFGITPSGGVASAVGERRRPGVPVIVKLKKIDGVYWDKQLMDLLENPAGDGTVLPSRSNLAVKCPGEVAGAHVYQPANR